ncbi:MAG: hemerythrin family protein [Leptospiraceae bacterium]|nr:hemerythrin family protein [Leptospiraceae bacterium]HRY14473.1 bacteriohemerythrin [Candidatus Competibacteraceae bacterium]
MKRQPIEWKNDYEIGIEDIDFQHHFFLNLINRLSNELATVDDLNYREALINELSAYARFHFISEENMMYRTGYPDLEQHRNLHRELIDKLSNEELYLFLHRSSKSIEQIIDFLLGWFFNHTLNADRLFANYLIKK